MTTISLVEGPDELVARCWPRVGSALLVSGIEGGLVVGKLVGGDSGDALLHGEVEGKLVVGGLDGRLLFGELWW